MVKRNNDLLPFYTSIMDDFLGTTWAAADESKRVPPMNVHEDEGFICIELRVPGVKKDDIKINYDNGYLTISGKSEHDCSSKKYMRQEFTSCAFERSIELPEDKYKVGEAVAAYADGILEVKMPKLEMKHHLSRQIQIQ